MSDPSASLSAAGTIASSYAYRAAYIENDRAYNDAMKSGVLQSENKRRAERGLPPLSRQDLEKSTVGKLKDRLFGRGEGK